MTAIQGFSASHIGTEDVMELSIETDRRMVQDDDIDVDLDLTEDQPLGEVDEDMTEELDSRVELIVSDSVEGLEGADALMEDDANEHGQRHAGSVQDEIIQDAALSESGADEDVIVDDLLDELEEPPAEREQETAIGVSDAGQSLDHFQEDFLSEAKGSITKSSAELGAEIQKSNIFRSGNDGTVNAYSVAPGKKEENDSSLQQESSNITSPPNNAARDTTNLTTNEEFNIIPTRQEVSEIAVSQNVETLTEDAVTAPDEAVLQPRKRLHPIFVVYQEASMSLFPSTQEDPESSQTFLLQDERLAAENIQTLLSACRSVLGESISEDDELVIAVDALGLQISEVEFGLRESTCPVPDSLQSSSAYTNLTVVQIAEVYSSLHANNGQYDPPPLYVHLYTRTSFPRRWNYLLGLMNEGKGFAQIPEAHDIDRQEHYEYPDQGSEDGDKATDSLTIAADLSVEEEAVGQGGLAFSNEDFGPVVGFNQSSERDEIDSSSVVNAQSRETNSFNLSSAQANDSVQTQETRDTSKHTSSATDCTSGQTSIPSECNNKQEQSGPTSDNEDFIDDEDTHGLGQNSPTDSSTLQGDNNASPKRNTADQSVSTMSANATVECFAHNDQAQAASAADSDSSPGNGDEHGGPTNHGAIRDSLDLQDELGDDEDQGQGSSIDYHDNADQDDTVVFDPHEEGSLHGIVPSGEHSQVSDHQDATDQENAYAPPDETLAQFEGTYEVQDLEDYSEEPGERHELDLEGVDELNGDLDTGESQSRGPETDPVLGARYTDEIVTEEDGEEYGLVQELDTNNTEVDDSELQPEDPRDVSNPHLEADDNFPFTEDELYDETVNQDKADLVTTSSPGSLKRPRSGSEIDGNEETDAQGKPGKILNSS